LVVYRDRSGIYWLDFPDLALFSVSADGRQVAGRAYGARSAATIEHLYISQVLPLASSLQGRILLHGGVVRITNFAIAFVAPSGSGKSTLTASFAKARWQYLSDDSFEITALENGFVVHPGHPSIRLWDDVEESLFQNEQLSTSHTDYSSKRRIFANNLLQHCDLSLPLACIYLLGRTPTQDIRITMPAASHSIPALVSQSFLLDVTDQRLMHTHLDCVSSLLAKQIVFNIDYPRRFDRLGDVRDAILTHANSVARNS